MLKKHSDWLNKSCDLEVGTSNYTALFQHIIVMLKFVHDIGSQRRVLCEFIHSVRASLLIKQPQVFYATTKEP